MTAFRAGWPDLQNKRMGRGWVWIGPYVVGTRAGLRRWDHPLASGDVEPT